MLESFVLPAKSGAGDPISAAASDGELGRALIARHPDAPRAAWQRYQPMVRGMLKRALGPESDIDDVVQDVFLCLFRRAHAIRDTDAVRPFVIGITRHTLHREIRRRRRRQQIASEYRFWPADVLRVGGGPATRYSIMKMHRLLQRLTEQERSAFVLRFSYGMTVNEVAKSLRTSEPTAKRRLSRAQARLSTWVQNDQFLVGYLQGRKTNLFADARW